PILLAGARPKRHTAVREGAPHRFGIHPAHHEHLEGIVLLNDRRDQPVGVENGAGDRLLSGVIPGLVVGHGSSCYCFSGERRTVKPASSRLALTWPTVSSPLWNTDAASTASAPAAIAGA